MDQQYHEKIQSWLSRPDMQSRRVTLMRAVAYLSGALHLLPCVLLLTQRILISLLHSTSILHLILLLSVLCNPRQFDVCAAHAQRNTTRHKQRVLCSILAK